VTTRQLQERVALLEAELAVERAVSRTDVLTGLPNRRAFEEALAAERGTVTVLLIDADGFKQVNDQHGHAAGDRLLAQIADALRLTVRTSDHVARLGGDEFAIILRRTDREHAATVARSLRQIQFGPVTLSIGVAEGDNPTEVLAEADRRMYAAKRTR
jgi:diguanylate cyclase (GGDEF)-like protein